MEGEPRYKFKHRAIWDAGKAYEVTELHEEDWGIPEIENKRSSIPIAFDLFLTYPTANANGLAISYPTAKRSIGTLAHQYLNKNHIMKGDYVTEDFQADRDTLLGTMIASRLTNEPEELAVFIDQPALCQVLGVIWVLSEHGEKIIHKMREAVAKGKKDAIGASYELYFNDYGFIWRWKLYQETYTESAEEAEILRNLYDCLGFSDGTIYVASSYEGEKPVLLAGGADGFVLFHGAGITENPAYEDTKGQFNLLAMREIPAYIAHAGLKRYAEQTNQEARVTPEEMQKLLEGFKSDFVKAIAGLAKPDGKEPKPIDEKAIAETVEKVLTAKKDELNTKFDEAVAAKVAEEKPKLEKDIREELEAEAKAFKEMLALCGEHDVEVKDKPEENERAIANDALLKYAKEPDSAMTQLKAEIFGIPNEKDPERVTAAGLPTGGGCG